MAKAKPLIDSCERSILAPPWERGDKDEACAWLGIRESAWDAMLSAGKIPRGAGPNKSNLTWHWTEVVAIGILWRFLCDDLDPEKKVGPS